MIQTINPYATARTAEIMSRYRPIAPKPQAPNLSTESCETDQNSSMPQSIRNSPYLRNVWAHLQARPTRTRKRGRTAAFPPPPPSLKRKRTTNCLQGLSPPPYPYQVTNSPSPMHGFLGTQNGLLGPQIPLVPLKCGGGLDCAVTTLAESVAALPTLRSTICLNMDEEADIINQRVFRELDFMPQLKEPVKPIVISPRPVRPVGSRIIVNCILKEEDDDSGRVDPKLKGPEEVEKEVEAEEVPAIVTDSGNRVRLTNSAYKEMVGQPECGWLDCVGSSFRRRRIGGDVVLEFGDYSEDQVEIMWKMNGFNCSNVRIEWESNTGKKSVVYASCNGVKLKCEGKDYQFLWKFHINN